MIILFKSSTVKNDDGWLQMSLGNSGIDNEDYVVTTQNLHSTDVPEMMMDAKTASELISGLLNCYFSNVDATKLSAEKIMDLGKEPENLDIYNPNQIPLF